MVKKKKTRKRLNLRKRLKSRKMSIRRRSVRKKLKKDISTVTDMFKIIDIDPIENVLESLLIREHNDEIDCLLEYK